MNKKPLTQVDQVADDINRLIARQFGRDDDRWWLSNVLVGAIATGAMMLASTSAVLLMAWALR